MRVMGASAGPTLLALLMCAMAVGGELMFLEPRSAAAGQPVSLTATFDGPRLDYTVRMVTLDAPDCGESWARKRVHVDAQLAATVDLVVADVNGDGFNDIVVCEDETMTASTNAAVGVYVNLDGEGTFSARRPFAAGFYCHSLARTSHGDLLVATWRDGESETLRGELLPLEAGGLFGAQREVSFNDTRLVRSVDMDADGIEDALVAGYGSVRVHKGDRAAASGYAHDSYEVIHDGDVTPTVLLPVDANGDNRTDLVFIEQFTQRIAWFENVPRGHGLFVRHELFNGTQTPYSDACATDMNGDALPDLVLVREGALEVLYNEGASGFARDPVLVSALPPHAVGPVVVDDIDGDGLFDFVVFGKHVVWGRRLPNDTFVVSLLVEFSYDSQRDIVGAVADVTGDGIKDVVVGASDFGVAYVPLAPQPSGARNIQTQVPFEITLGRGDYTVCASTDGGFTWTKEGEPYGNPWFTASVVCAAGTEVFDGRYCVPCGGNEYNPSPGGQCNVCDGTKVSTYDRTDCVASSVTENVLPAPYKVFGSAAATYEIELTNKHVDTGHMRVRLGAEDCTAFRVSTNDEALRPHGHDLRASAQGRISSDAWDDIAVASFASNEEPSEVWWHRGGGTPDQPFAREGTLVYSLGNTQSVVADLALGPFTSQDAHDLVIATAPTKNHGSLPPLMLARNRNYTLSAPEAIPTPVDFVPAVLHVADVNNDTHADLVVGTSGGTIGLLVLLGNGTGGFETVPLPLLTITEVVSLDTGDVDGDGVLDAVVVTADGALFWLQGDGTGHFAVSAPPVAASGVRVARVADVDADGRADVIGTAFIANLFGDDELLWWSNDDARGHTWTPHPMGYARTVRQVEVADYDVDGDLDVLFTWASGGLQPGVSSWGVSVAENVGAGNRNGRFAYPMALFSRSHEDRDMLINVHAGHVLPGAPTVTYVDQRGVEVNVPFPSLDSGDVAHLVVGEDQPRGVYTLCVSRDGGVAWHTQQLPHHFVVADALCAAGEEVVETGSAAGTNSRAHCKRCDATSISTHAWAAHCHACGEGMVSTANRTECVSAAPITAVRPPYTVTGVATTVDFVGASPGSTHVVALRDEAAVARAGCAWYGASQPLSPTSVFDMQFVADLVGNDDAPDLVVMTLDFAMTLFANDGHGDYRELSQQLAGPNELSALVAVDLVGGGCLDMVGTDHSERKLVFLENINCTGRFAAAHVIDHATEDVSALAIVDIDRDGVDDVVGGKMSGGVNVWLGNGHGVELPPLYALALPVDVVCDTAATLGHSPVVGGAVLVVESDGSQPSALTWVYMANTAKLEMDTVRVVADVNGNPSACASDFSGDGLVDVVVGSPDGLAWYWQRVAADGTISFERAGGNDIGKGGSIDDVVCMDVNDDGLEDILVVLSTNQLSWLRNTGTGAFADPEVFVQDAMMTRCASVDADGDGDDDLVCAAQPEAAVVFNEARPKNSSAGVLKKVLPWTAHGSFSQFVDMDGDGDEDVLTCQGRMGVLWVENTDGHGAFTRMHRMLHSDVPDIYLTCWGAALPRPGRASHAMDAVVQMSIDTNGAPELLWLQRQADGSFAAHDIARLVYDVGDLFVAPVVNPHAAHHDVIALQSVRVSSHVEMHVFLWAYNGTGFPVGVDVSGDGMSVRTGSVEVEDLTGDGLLDVLVRTSDNNLVLLENMWESNATFVVHTLGAVPCGFHCGMAVGDVDGDHRPDLVLSANEGAPLGWVRNLGGGHFDMAHRSVIDSANDAVQVEAVDVNGDGKLDVVALSPSAPSLVWYDNPTWQARSLEVSQLAYQYPMYAADINGDGVLDVVTGATVDHVLLGAHDVLRFTLAESAQHGVQLEHDGEYGVCYAVDGELFSVQPGVQLHTGACGGTVLPSGACQCAAHFQPPACTACEPGRTGAHCDECEAHHYGATCAPCDCHHGTCDDGVHGTGVCSCAPGWNGTHCDTCKEGHYGASCVPCTCQHGTCDDGIHGSGMCTGACEPHWRGSKCDQCARGYYGARCEPCMCSSLHGTCDDGVDGSGNCWTCNRDYYGPECTHSCECVYGSCDAGVGGTGACTCFAEWSGPHCSECPVGHWVPNPDDCACYCLNVKSCDGCTYTATTFTLHLHATEETMRSVWGDTHDEQAASASRAVMDALDENNDRDLATGGGAVVRQLAVSGHTVTLKVDMVEGAAPAMLRWARSKQLTLSSMPVESIVDEATHERVFGSGGSSTNIALVAGLSSAAVVVALLVSVGVFVRIRRTRDKSSVFTELAG